MSDPNYYAELEEAKVLYGEYLKTCEGDPLTFDEWVAELNRK